MTTDIDSILQALANGKISLPQAKQSLQALQAQPLGFATIDHHRVKRSPMAEVIFAQHKTADQIIKITSAILAHEQSVLITRATADHIQAITAYFSGSTHHLEIMTHCPTLLIGAPPRPRTSTRGIVILTAGTSDLFIAEEAQLTAKAMGTPAKMISDVGVAGLHRLLNRLPEIEKASAVVCIAGMEGALPSVLAGLIQIPIIAVPSSVGYGSNQEGITTLLAMLSSCAAGVTVVNIDNGFGAAYAAGIIDQNSAILKD